MTPHERQPQVVPENLGTDEGQTIARRNAAAIQPDRIQTRCRDDGAWAQVFATSKQV